ncbi:MAG: rhodanese-related sulfurtransferase [Bacteroidetes bacterium]|nr:rhodanese-related sulfurtransferase [Bacteroidota bacterium]
MERPYQILLYYYFRPLQEPQAVVEAQERLCRELGLLGRILVASEGLNGTVAGPRAATRAYMEHMRDNPLFPGIEFKVDDWHEVPFLKLHVRLKNEIVNLSAPEELRPWEESGEYVEPEEMRRLLREQPEDVVILDARSNYETRLGRFKGALTLDIDNFRDLPDKLHELEHLKDKTIVTYCTGGIKCEKVTALMKKRGFEHVKQLHGGIVRYAHETGGEDFEGNCYVFDGRVSVPVNQVNPTVISPCSVCGAHTVEMVNCANADCNAHLLVCHDCQQQLEGCCSRDCMHSERRRVYDGKGIYYRGVNSKKFVKTGN